MTTRKYKKYSPPCPPTQQCAQSLARPIFVEFLDRWPLPHCQQRSIQRPCGGRPSKIERLKQVLWTELLGEEAAPLHGIPDMEYNANACSEELVEAAVLHGCHPDGPDILFWMTRASRKKYSRGQHRCSCCPLLILCPHRQSGR